jgi:uncharacterized membrane protein YcaP (DUF421 family)
MQHLLEVYDQLGIVLAAETGASDSLIHVHAGMAVLLLARVVTRRSLATWTPFLVVVVAALANEANDRLVNGAWLIPDSIYDLINTLFWPFVLMIGLRLRRARERKARRG